MASVEALPKEILFRMPRTGWITTWNTQCGIASYSKHLIETMSDEITILATHTDQRIMKDDVNVHRCWQAGDGNDLNALNQTIDRLELNALIIQFNYSFFDFDHFPSFLNEQLDKESTIVLMLHSTTDAESTPHKKLSKLIPVLKRCDRILVHTPDDLNRLKTYRLVENVAIFPHGIPDWHRKKESRTNKTFTLASYGFFLPHKGLLELIETFKILREKGVDIKLKMVNAQYPVPLSTQLIKQAKEKIQTLGLDEDIEMITDFLSDKACLKELSTADLILFPYQETGESSSAAVRYGLATGNPVAVTPLKIFDDVGDAVFKLPGTTANDMADGIEKIITEIQTNSEFAISTQKKSQRWVEAHHYVNISQRLFQMIEALHQKK